MGTDSQRLFFPKRESVFLILSWDSSMDSETASVMHILKKGKRQA